MKTKMFLLVVVLLCSATTISAQSEYAIQNTTNVGFIFMNLVTLICSFAGGLYIAKIISYRKTTRWFLPFLFILGIFAAFLSLVFWMQMIYVVSAIVMVVLGLCMSSDILSNIDMQKILFDNSFIYFLSASTAYFVGVGIIRHTWIWLILSIIISIVGVVIGYSIKRKEVE